MDLVVVVVDGVIPHNLFVLTMYASMACAAAAGCIPIEGHTHFIPHSSAYPKRQCVPSLFHGLWSSVSVVGCRGVGNGVDVDWWQWR